MLSSIRRFLEDRLPGGTGAPDPQESEQAVRLATSALLFEIARADGVIRDEERTVMRASIQATFGLSKQEADELADLAERESRTATSLYELTHVVDQTLSAEEKKRVVELLWLVAFADSEKDPQEEALVRRIAGLLHVPHPDFINAKIRARERSGTPRV
jgi:uncharacterized tellurite resistance protein B-like protein